MKFDRREKLNNRFDDYIESRIDNIAADLCKEIRETEDRLEKQLYEIEDEMMEEFETMIEALEEEINSEINFLENTIRDEINNAVKAQKDDVIAMEERLVSMMKLMVQHNSKMIREYIIKSRG